MARDTVHQYLAHLEDCFLVRTVWMESRSERQRMVNPRKAYPVDTGLMGVFDRHGEAKPGSRPGDRRPRSSQLAAITLGSGSEYNIMLY